MSANQNPPEPLRPFFDLLNEALCCLNLVSAFVSPRALSAAQFIPAQQDVLRHLAPLGLGQLRRLPRKRLVDALQQLRSLPLSQRNPAAAPKPDLGRAGPGDAHLLKHALRGKQ
jgi:hypothetical protein